LENRNKETKEKRENSSWCKAANMMHRTRQDLDLNTTNQYKQGLV